MNSAVSTFLQEARPHGKYWLVCWAVALRLQRRRAKAISADQRRRLAADVTEYAEWLDNKRRGEALPPLESSEASRRLERATWPIRLVQNAEIICQRQQLRLLNPLVVFMILSFNEHSVLVDVGFVVLVLYVLCNAMFIKTMQTLFLTLMTQIQTDCETSLISHVQGTTVWDKMFMTWSLKTY